MEAEGLALLEKAGKRVGLPVVTEIMDPHDIELFVEHADMLQVGARNAQNFSLLRRLGRTKKPILLKRGMSTRLEEFLMAAEYILSEGNPNVVLCERGIRTFETATRNTLDLNAVPLLKEWTHLPVIVDPSHGTGIWSLAFYASRSLRERDHDFVGAFSVPGAHDITMLRISRSVKNEHPDQHGSPHPPSMAPNSSTIIKGTIQSMRRSIASPRGAPRRTSSG